MFVNSFTRHSLAKWALAGLLIFIGVSAGIYTGNALSGFRNSENTDANATYLEIGQKFPDYVVKVLQMQGSNSAEEAARSRLSDLLPGRPAILVFSSVSCGACDAMESYWNKKVLPDVDPSVRIVLVFDSLEAPPSHNPFSAFGGTMFFTDRMMQMKEDGISATPTIIGVSEDMTIRFIYTGFDRRVSGKLINEMLL